MCLSQDMTIIICMLAGLGVISLLDWVLSFIRSDEG